MCLSIRLWHSYIVIPDVDAFLMDIENNFTSNYSGDITCRNHRPSNLSLVEVPEFSGETEVGCEKAITGAENRKYL